MRYLSESEVRSLQVLEREVLTAAAVVRIGPLAGEYSAKASELSRLRRSLHALATRRLFEDIHGSLDDPTRLWSLVKKFRVGTESGSSLPIDTLVHHFCSVFNREGDPVPVVFCDPFPSEEDSDLDAPFSLEELEGAVRGLSRGTAPGTTGVGNDVLISLFHLPGGPEFFLALFNACLEGAELPHIWRCTEIFLLYKGKGLLTDPGSYRGIALMDSSLKLYEKLLYARLAPWASARSLIPDCQFGFRAGAGTLDAVFVLFSLIWKYANVLKSPLFAALIDFQRAFPSVSRSLLIAKLGSLGVSVKFQRCLCAIFYRNTFSIRAGHQVSHEFPVSTGLREGSVLSPLLFSLFISDMTTEVIAPFAGFLQADPTLNGVKIPGLLYADDLVLLCLSADLLRLRLRHLAAYAYTNKLQVNVKKCEVVVFGGGANGHGSFQYEGQYIPVRLSCKYLGVWLDADRSGRSLKSAILEKFKAGVPVFFSICRRMRIGDLSHVFRLAQALLFSLLYGAEFLGTMEVIQRCEALWWRGVRQFYGLPNGVSNVTLQLLFPRFNLLHKVFLGKVSLMLRGLSPRPTLFPEALIYDRGHLFAKHRVGFTESIRTWGVHLGLTNAHLETSQMAVAGQLEGARGHNLDGAWEVFSRMTSTKYIASILGNRRNFYQVASEASRFSRLGLRVFLLAATGSLAQSYISSRFCPHCFVKFDFVHFLSCGTLGEDLRPALVAASEREDWKDFSAIIMSRFRVFIHLYRHGQCDSEECDLFERLDFVHDEEEV
jgi:hypothetical protein